MSISLLSGTPGSGKSLHAVSDGLEWLKLGRNLITNFPLDWHKRLKKIKGDYQFWKNSDITPVHLIDYAKEHHKKSVKAQTLLIIDEASMMFNARDFGRKDRMEWINFLANHRHFNFEIILIAQNDKMLDKQIRGLIEYDIKHRAFANYNFITLLISKLFGGLFMTVSYWYPCRAKNGVGMFRFSRSKAKCYDTMALFVGEDSSSSVSSNKSKSSKKSSKVVIVNEQATSNNTQQSKDNVTTVLDNSVSYNLDTGVSVISTSTKS